MDLMDIRRGLMMGTGSRLPGEYQEVKYLSSSDRMITAINTGIPITFDLEMEVQFRVPNPVKTRYFMGKYVGTDFYLYLGGGNVFQTAFGCSWRDTSLQIDALKHTFVYRFDDNNVIVEENGNQIMSGKKNPLSQNTIKIAGYLASENERNQVTGCETYHAKFIKNGSVIREFIPCYRKADNEPGMYDIINDVFYTNVGTDPFNVGPAVN